ncbi:MAG: type II secretion system F family protein [Solirubrobacteraceae bacterium]
MNVGLLFSSLCLVVGGLLLVVHALSGRRPALASRLARAQGTRQSVSAGSVGESIPEPLREWGEQVYASYEGRLRRAGKTETVGLFLAKKALLAFAVPFVPLLPYAAATDALPSLAVVLVLAVIGFWLPDLALRTEAKQRREALFLDLPEALAVMSLSLRAGQSLRQALELAARDCEGVLGDELTRALSLARRDRQVGEREALVMVARESGEPTFTRFAELLAAKESPYGEFLKSQAAQMRAEQHRYLERAADRAYLAMHAPLVPLLAVLVLLIAYGFLHFFSQAI